MKNDSAQSPQTAILNPMKGFEAATIEFLSSLTEAELQGRIVEPLLRLQGFTHVRDTSGPNDKGKDLVAVAVEFGKTKLYAIQIKRFRFSGKHSKSNALTNVLTQLRQIFGEPVLDPTVTEKRLADRCLFITPFAIGRDAFESSLCQLKELERREISIVDGPLLADLVLKHMPEVVAKSSVNFRYRNRIAGACNHIKESSAFGISRALELDNIYVELSLRPADAGIEDLAFGKLALGQSKIVKATARDLNNLKKEWAKWTEQIIPLSEKPAATALTKDRIDTLTKEIQGRRKELTKDLGLYRGFDDSHPVQAALLAELTELETAKIAALDLDPLLQVIKAKSQGFMDEYLKIQSPEVSNSVCTGIVQRGLRMIRDLRSLREIPLVTNNWPMFLQQSKGVPFRGKRLPSTAILKIDLPTFVTGSPGAGKTTLMRRLVQTMARHSSGQLPLLLYLVQFQSVQNCDIVEAAMRELDTQGVTLTPEAFRRSLEAGAYRVFFDGLDEAGANADVVLARIQDFVARYPKCPTVITTRESLRGKIWRDALQIRLAQLDDQQMDDFLKNWFTAEPTKLESISEWLRKNVQMREAARTPIVTTLLCSLIHADADMPTTEVELYEQRFELLLGRWEKAKGIQPLSQDLRRIYWHFLMNLAAELHNSGTRSFPRERVINLAVDYFAKPYHRTPDGLVSDCIHRGLIEQETFGGLSFGHLTYQEYLVARWLSHHNRTRFIWEKLLETW